METISEYLDNIEISNFNRNYEIVSNLRNEFSKTVNQYLEYEIIVLNTKIEKGEFKKETISVDKYGETIEYPQFEDIDKFTEYIVKRNSDSNNVYLKARYSTFLFNIVKHHRYAELAIASYLLSEELFEQRDSESDNLGRLALDCIVNAFYISKKTKINTEKVRIKIFEMIYKYSNASSSFFVIRADLIEIIISNQKIFGDYINTELILFLKSFVDILIDKKRYHNSITILNQCILLSEKIYFNDINWNEIIGDVNGLIVEDMGESFASLSFCRNAIDSYKKSGNKTKYSEHKKKYEQISENMDFKKFKIDLDYDKLIEESELISNEVIKFESNEIIYGLIFDKRLLPIYKNVLESSLKAYNNAVFHLLANTMIFDQRGNEVEHITTEDEKKNHQLYQSYRILLDLKMITVDKIFEKSTFIGKLSLEILMKHFKENTWYGVEQQVKLGTGEIYKYNWLKQIGEPLREYFNQIEIYQNSNKKIYPNFILSIDSLGAKIEGLIRDLYTMHRFPTVLHTYDNSQRKISREMDLNHLLREENFNKLFDEDEIMFFKYILTDQKGLNIRNRLAHSLLYPDEYHFQIMNLLILVLLKIGKYTLVEKST